MITNLSISQQQLARPTLRIQPVVPRRVPPRARVVPRHEPTHPLPLLGPLLGVLTPLLLVPAMAPAPSSSSCCCAFSFYETKERFSSVQALSATELSSS